LKTLQSARILGLAARRVVAACHKDRQPIVWTDPDLMPVNPGVDRPRLPDLVARGRVGINAVNPDRTRIAERDHQMLGGNIGRHMDRARRQRYRIPVRRQRAGGRIDAEGGHMMRVADRAHSRRAIARGDIEIPARSMRPGVMNIRRQRHGTAPDQRGALDVDVVMRKFRPDTGVKRRFIRGGLG